jgi:hypothetical protein
MAFGYSKMRTELGDVNTTSCFVAIQNSIGRNVVPVETQTNTGSWKNIWKAEKTYEI